MVLLVVMEMMNSNGDERDVDGVLRAQTLGISAVSNCAFRAVGM